MSMRGSAKHSNLASSTRRIELLSLQGDVREGGYFKETSKKKAKEKSGVTLDVIHLGIDQLPMCCDQTKYMLDLSHHVYISYSIVK